MSVLLVLDNIKDPLQKGVPNFQYFKWPNIENRIMSSGHTACTLLSIKRHYFRGVELNFIFIVAMERELTEYKIYFFQFVVKLDHSNNGTETISFLTNTLAYCKIRYRLLQVQAGPWSSGITGFDVCID